MNSCINLNRSDWLWKEFYGEDWRWRNSHMPNSRDQHGWGLGSAPAVRTMTCGGSGRFQTPDSERNSLLREWIPQRTWLYQKPFSIGEEVRGQRVAE